MNRELEKLQPRSLSSDESELAWQRIERRMTRMPDTKPKYFPLIHKPMFAPIFLTLILVFAGGVATIAASDNAKPGDTLFSVDRAVEETRLRVTTSADAKAKLQMAFARERLDEATTLASESDVSAKASANVTTALESAIKHLTDIRTEFSAQGNTEAAAQLDVFIHQLRALAESDVATWESADVRVETSPATVKTKVKAVADDLKVKLELFGRSNTSVDTDSNSNANGNGNMNINANVNGGTDDGQDDDGVEIRTRVNINASSNSNSSGSGSSSIKVNVNGSGSAGSVLDFDLNGDSLEEVRTEVRSGVAYVTAKTNDNATYEFNLQADTRAEVAAQVADAFGVTTAEVEAVLSFEVK